MTTYDISYTDKEILTPEEYLNLSEEKKLNIEESYIVPPSIDSGNFGGIAVRYKYPEYKIRINDVKF